MHEIDFDQAYIKYRATIERYLQRHFGLSVQDAEDLVADTFVVLHLHWDEFAHHHEGAIAVFLYRTARFKALQHHKARKKHPVVFSLEDLFEHATEAHEQPDAKEEHDAYLAYLDKIKAILSPRELTVFCYKVEKGYTTAEIAHLMGITEISVRVKWHQIRKKITKKLPEIFEN